MKFHNLLPPFFINSTKKVAQKWIYVTGFSPVFCRNFTGILVKKVLKER